MNWLNSQSKIHVTELAVSLPVAFIEEGTTVIAYTPSLDLSTCGQNKTEAKKMFEEAVQIFFDDLVESNTVDEVLSGLGWKKDLKQASWVPPVVSQESIGVKVPALA
ncbi:MAG: hypothetical protein WC880_03310 [Candidatus Paceibacterota bacterium]